VISNPASEGDYGINEPQENPLMRSQIEKPALMSPFQTVPAADKK
jgi:hypothetical protein